MSISRIPDFLFIFFTTHPDHQHCNHPIFSFDHTLIIAISTLNTIEIQEMSYQYGKYQKATSPPLRPPPPLMSSFQEKKKEISKNVNNERTSNPVHDPVSSNIVSTSFSVAPFIQLLWKIMKDESNREHIDWSVDGLKIKIYNPHVFSQTVIPKFFKHKNIPSFVRQLNLYGACSTWIIFLFFFLFSVTSPRSLLS